MSSCNIPFTRSEGHVPPESPEMTKKTYRLHCKEMNEMKLRPSHPRLVSVPQWPFDVVRRKIVFLSEPEGRSSVLTACLLSISVVSGRPISGIVLVYSRRISLYHYADCTSSVNALQVYMNTQECALSWRYPAYFNQRN